MSPSWPVSWLRVTPRVTPATLCGLWSSFFCRAGAHNFAVYHLQVDTEAAQKGASTCSQGDSHDSAVQKLMTKGFLELSDGASGDLTCRKVHRQRVSYALRARLESRTVSKEPISFLHAQQSIVFCSTTRACSEECSACEEGASTELRKTAATLGYIVARKKGGPSEGSTRGAMTTSWCASAF